MSRSEQSTSGRGRRDSGRLDQRVELEAKGAAAEREGLDQDGVGLCRREGRQQRRSPGAPQLVVDRPALRVDELFERRVAGSDRRQLDDALGGSAIPASATGSPPETRVTSTPSRASASTIRNARRRCPIPSRCWT